MGQGRREKPERLAEKLLTVRRRMRASQSQMAAILGGKVSTARISEYEHGTREPNLMVLLRYAQVAGVAVEDLIDDALRLPTLRNK